MSAIFKGTRFIWDGEPCEEYGVFIVDLGNSRKGVNIASAGSVTFGHASGNWRQVVYKRALNTPLELNFTVGLLPGWGEPLWREYPLELERSEVARITQWFVGKEGFRRLKILQPDLENVCFKCFVEKLERVDLANFAVGFNVTAKCDGPFAYKDRRVLRFDINGVQNFTVFGDGCANAEYCPDLVITPKSANIAVKNNDTGKTCAFSGLAKTSGYKITIDGASGTVRADNADLPNMYRFFNFGFLDLKQGFNNITATGNFALEIAAEFPVDIGG